MKTPMKHQFLEPSVLTNCEHWFLPVPEYLKLFFFLFTHFSWTVWDFHSSDYEEYYLSWCDAALSSRSLLVFHRKVLPLCTGSSSNLNKQPVRRKQKAELLICFAYSNSEVLPDCTASHTRKYRSPSWIVCHNLYRDPPLLIFSGLHGIIYQKIEFFNF
jgi:hypothetical protein